MGPNEFVTSLAAGGMTFAEDDEGYCPVHGWDGPTDLYHHVECDAYAEHIGLA